MPVTSFDDALRQCVDRLLSAGEAAYTASGEDELTQLLEAVALQMEEQERTFTFSLEGLTVRFRLNEGP